MPFKQIESVNNEVCSTIQNQEVFSYMCNLAMEKCSKKLEKKRASCGGAAMRKRLLLKNFVAQMLTKERLPSTLEEGDLDVNVNDSDEKDDFETDFESLMESNDSDGTFSEKHYETSDEDTNASNLDDISNNIQSSWNGKRPQTEHLQLQIDQHSVVACASVKEDRMLQHTSEEKISPDEYDWDLEDSFTVIPPSVDYIHSDGDSRQFDFNRGFVSYDYYTPLESMGEYSCSLQTVPSESPPSESQMVEKPNFKTNASSRPLMNCCRTSAAYDHCIVDLDTKTVVDEDPMSEVSTSCRLSRKRPISALDKLDENLSQMMMLAKRVRL